MQTSCEPLCYQSNIIALVLTRDHLCCNMFVSLMDILVHDRVILLELMLEFYIFWNLLCPILAILFQRKA